MEHIPGRQSNNAADLNGERNQQTPFQDEEIDFFGCALTNTNDK